MERQVAQVVIDPGAQAVRGLDDGTVEDGEEQRAQEEGVRRPHHEGPPGTAHQVRYRGSGGRQVAAQARPARAARGQRSRDQQQERGRRQRPRKQAEGRTQGIPDEAQRGDGDGHGRGETRAQRRASVVGTGEQEGPGQSGQERKEGRGQCVMRGGLRASSCCLISARSLVTWRSVSRTRLSRMSSRLLR